MTGAGASGPISPVLIGRTTELAQLQRIVEKPPALVLVEGEAGVGKTRLLREWLATAPLARHAQLIGHCTPLREPLPFGPVVDALAGAAPWLPTTSALSPVAGALRPLLPELAEHLPAGLAPLGNRRQERHRVFRGIHDLLARLGPAVLVLEDLQWIDGTTHELLRYLVERLPRDLTVVLTYRREDLADPHAPALFASGPPKTARSRIVLSPLDSTQVADLVTAIRGEPLPAEFAGHLHERTMGLPLAIEETLGLLGDRQLSSGHREREPHPLPDPVPSALRDALLERVSRLRATARKLLHVAAILQTPATDALLTRIAGVPERHALNALVELVGRGLLQPVEPDRYALRHDLVCQVVDESLAEPLRRQLHRRAIDALAATDPTPFGQLARHCRAAGQTDDWLRYTEAAADQASALGNDEAAAELLHDAVTRAETSRETRLRLAIKLGRAALTGLGHVAALEILRHTLCETDLPVEVRGELRLYLGVLLRNQAGSVLEGREQLELAITELQERPAPAVRAMASLGAPHLRDGCHIDDHVAWLTAAHQRAQHVADPAVAALVTAEQASALAAIGDARGWQIGLPLAKARPSDPAGQVQQYRLTVHLAWAATWAGRYADAEMLLCRGADHAATPAGSYLYWCLAGTRLLYDYAVGNWDGLAERAQEVVAATADVPSVRGEAHIVLGMLALAGGQLREAESYLTSAQGTVPAVAATAGGLARIAAATGDARAAAERVEHGLGLVRDKGVWCWAAELAPIAVAIIARTAAQVPVARKLLDEMAAGLVGRDSPWAHAAITAARALLTEADGDHLAAAAAHGDAARAFAALPRPYAEAQCLEAHARCLLAAGRDGAQALTEAMDRFARLGASWDVSRCRHLLRSLGRRLPHRRGRRGYGEELSPRERDVVRLVRTGLTNREIAEALFLSPRTVEAHVARVLRKLGLSSRRALAGSGRPSTAGGRRRAD